MKFAKHLRVVGAGTSSRLIGDEQSSDRGRGNDTDADDLAEAFTLRRAFDIRHGHFSNQLKNTSQIVNVKKAARHG